MFDAAQRRTNPLDYQLCRVYIAGQGFIYNCLDDIQGLVRNSVAHDAGRIWFSALGNWRPTWARLVTRRELAIWRMVFALQCFGVIHVFSRFLNKTDSHYQ